jgi:hypothetical protein
VTNYRVSGFPGAKDCGATQDRAHAERCQGSGEVRVREQEAMTAGDFLATFCTIGCMVLLVVIWRML